MTFNLKQLSMSLYVVILCNAQLHAEGQFEKLVYRKLPKHLNDCRTTTLEYTDAQGNKTTVFKAFEEAIKNLTQNFNDFIDPRNAHHAYVHAAKIRTTLNQFKEGVLNPIVQHFEQNRGNYDAKTQTAFAALIKLLNKMHTDLHNVTKILSDYKGSLSLLDLKALGDSIMRDEWAYLLPERYFQMPSFSIDPFATSWKSILETRYSPKALRE